DISLPAHSSRANLPPSAPPTLFPPRERRAPDPALLLGAVSHWPHSLEWKTNRPAPPSSFPPRQRRGPDTALRLSAVSHWAHSLEWEQAPCPIGPTFQSGNNEGREKGR